MAGKTDGKVTRPEAITQDEFNKAAKAAVALSLTRAPDAQAFVDIVAREKLKAIDADGDKPLDVDKLLEVAANAYRAEHPMTQEGGSRSSKAPEAPAKPDKGVKKPQTAEKIISAGSPTTMEPGPALELDDDLALDESDIGASAPAELDIDKLRRPDGMTERRFEQLVADAITYQMPLQGAQAYIDGHIGTVASTKDDQKGGSYPTMIVGRDKVHCPTARLPDGRLTRSIPKEGALLPWYLHPAPPPKGCVIVPEEVMTMAAEEGLTDADIRELMKSYARKQRMRALSKRLA